jgi:hypothetical protein
MKVKIENKLPKGENTNWRESIIEESKEYENS